MRQIGLAILNFESSHKLLPAGGEGTDPNTKKTAFTRASLFTILLPFIEKQDVYQNMDINRSYRDVNAGAAAAGGHHLESDGWHVQRQRLGCLHQHLHLRLPEQPVLVPGHA